MAAAQTDIYAMFAEAEREGRVGLARKTRLNVWTVNSEADIDLCLDLGVAALITDRPGVTQTYLEKRFS